MKYDRSNRFRTGTALRAGSGGFALIVVLLVMVLLSILALGMLSLSSISLRHAGANGAQATARSNARLALMLALGELQKQTGPDQRVTATADMAGNVGGAKLSTGVPPQNLRSVNGVSKGLSAIQNGSRYWTGVWKNSNANGEFAMYTQTPSPIIAQWLVSGNEASAAGVPLITPASAAITVGTTGRTPDPKTAVVLVGAKTVGPATISNLSHFVAVPLVGTKSTSSATTVDGRYGWWIGDEGVKARFNLPADAATGTVANYTNFNPRRRGWETTISTATITGYPLPGADAALNKVVSLDEAEELSTSLVNSSTGPLSQVFHAATCDSNSVLTNTVAGGLRFDLTAWLESLPTSVTNVLNPPLPGKNIIPVSIAPNIKGPKWDQLKAFKNLNANMSGGKLVCTPAADVNSYAIAPIISDLRVLMGAKLETVSSTNYKIHPCGKIAIVLANPYPYPLKWTTGLDVELKHEIPPNSSGTYYPSRIWSAPGNPAFLPYNSSQPAVFNQALFRIAPGEIPAGECRAFTMTGSAIVRASSGVTPVVVPMGPLESSDATNFEICVMLTNDTQATSDLSLDVRESWNTSPLCVELRPAGASTILRRLERFELDNGNYTNTVRTVSATLATPNPAGGNMIKPFPLMHYSFQISQPGTDYSIVMPSSPANEMGLRGSTLRTFTDFNLQATRFRKPITSYNPPPYFMESTNALATLPFAQPGGNTGTDFAKNLAFTPVKWGRSTTDTSKVVLFSPPPTLVSLAQFQHADLTADDNSVSVGHQPGNAVGNSYASPFVKRLYAQQSRNDWALTEIVYSTGFSTPNNYYDISYLLNTALWDGYFFSTIPRTASTTPLNPVIMKTGGTADQSAELRDGLKAAGHLMVNGGFNINSTEKDAWKALLTGSKYLGHPAGGTSNDALFARSLEQTVAGSSTPTGVAADSYAGYRRLTDVQIEAIATQLANQVRLRGPFLSVSQFVNRALVDLGPSPGDDKTVMGRCGALQAALDLSGVNIKPDATQSAFPGISPTFDQLKLQAEGGGSVPAADMAGSRASSGFDTTDWASVSRDLSPGSLASIMADRSLLSSPMITEQGFRSTGIPAWVTQADVLQVIGPSITARSDTFRIRAYGEAVDTSGNAIAHAWCEAIVQRTPAYIDQTNAPSDRSTALSVVNRTFGRAYSIVSFRWLSPDEI